MVSMVGSAPRRRLRLLCSSLSVGRSQLGGFGPKGESPDRWSLPPLEKRTLLVNKSLLFLRQGVHAQTHCWLCILYCFLQCFLLLDNAALGGGGGGQEQLFLRVMFSAFVHLHWFLQCFSRFRALVFCTICVFPRFLQCFEASWRCSCYAAHWGGVGWGNRVHANLITLLRLHHVADATLHIGVGWGGVRWGGMLTFYVTCSRCWCYATLGWGGC